MSGLERCVVDLRLWCTGATQVYSAADLLAIPVRLDAAHAIAPNKVMVINGMTVITGLTFGGRS